MPRAIILQHVPGEGPGRLAHLLAARGVTTEIRRLFQGDAVPQAEADDALLVVMGGSMGVADIGGTNHPFLAVEADLLRHRIAHDLPTLGICLGAQLLAHAAGAAVVQNRTADGQRIIEVGWEPITLTSNDPVLAGLPRQLMVLHWHGDTFALPTGAVLLGSTLRCVNQGFRLKQRLFGLQFHPEVERAMVPEWVRDDADYVRLANGPEGGARVLADTERVFDAHVPGGDRLLGNILDAMLA
jgi:GMP synthase-like glutamine amidotransferase